MKSQKVSLQGEDKQSRQQLWFHSATDSTEIFLTPSLISKKMTHREMKQLLVLENGQSQRAMGES